MIDKEKQEKICANCFEFCQEGHIDIPCKGTFQCEDIESEAENE